MNASLRAIAKRVSTESQARLRQAHVSSMTVKVGLIALGSAVVAIVQCVGLPAEGPWPALGVIGVVAAVLVFVGSVIVLIMDRDPSAQLALADEAIRAAEGIEAQLVEEAEQYDALWIAINRATDLYYSLMAMRGALERLTISDRADEPAAIDHLLEVSEPTLLPALGFELGQNYTICVYRAENEADGKKVLRLIAHRRALNCALSAARTWAEGVGAAGIAYATGRELTLPDMLDPALKSLREQRDSQRVDGADPYMSIVAVPVFVGPSNTKWGVVVATSDVRNHFSAADEEDGVRTSEGARALAGMVALAVGLNHP